MVLNMLHISTSMFTTSVSANLLFCQLLSGLPAKGVPCVVLIRISLIPSVVCFMWIQAVPHSTVISTLQVGSLVAAVLLLCCNTIISWCYQLAVDLLSLRLINIEGVRPMKYCVVCLVQQDSCFSKNCFYIYYSRCASLLHQNQILIECEYMCLAYVTQCID